ncbi:MAG: CPBP family intramembrane metalloprotease [Proteobacteria bacterium]|nr:CPBP family intramembrane metalloprotease [Pseudomonadota bacterium]
MRALGLFVAAIVATVLLAAALAYPLYLVVHPLRPEWWFDKIGARLWEFGLLPLALVWVVRRLRLTRREDWGYGAPRPRWLRQFWLGLGAGLVTMLPVTLSMLALGLRVPAAGLGAATVGKAVLAGLGSGLAVGFIEESFFRGLIQGAVVRELGRPLLAIGLVAALFALLHFLGSERVPHEQVGWHSGLVLLEAAVRNFLTPALVLDRLLSLFAVGVLLGLAAWWTGSIALAVGLHAGWVWMMRATVGSTALDPAAPLAWMVSRGDGYTGWLVLAWTVALTLAAVAARRRLRALRPHG